MPICGFWLLCNPNCFDWAKCKLTAVIIGAMLISPLMGPIVGAGFALATYDFEILKKAGRSLLIATVVSLLVAALYFFISPF